MCRQLRGQAYHRFLAAHCHRMTNQAHAVKGARIVCEIGFVRSCAGRWAGCRWHEADLPIGPMRRL